MFSLPPSLAENHEQAGVFVSRSSGLFLPPSMALLWAMPTLQLCLLVFFTLDALLHFWLNHALLVLCFVAGLLGGAVRPRTSPSLLQPSCAFPSPHFSCSRPSPFPLLLLR